jgi:hypothetical protein
MCNDKPPRYYYVVIPLSLSYVVGIFWSLLLDGPQGEEEEV